MLKKGRYVNWIKYFYENSILRYKLKYQFALGCWWRSPSWHCSDEGQKWYASFNVCVRFERLQTRGCEYWCRSRYTYPHSSTCRMYRWRRNTTDENQKIWNTRECKFTGKISYYSMVYYSWLEFFIRYHMYIDICSMFKSLTTLCCVKLFQGVNINYFWLFSKVLMLFYR